MRASVTSETPERLREENAALRRELAELRARQARHRETEAALRRREARTQSVLETSPVAVLAVDRGGRIQWANGRAGEMFRYPIAELTGQPLEMLLPERLRDAHRSHRAGFFADPRVRPMGLDLELAGRRKDGTEFPVEISLSYLRTDEELLALSFILDVTARKDAEKRLQTEFAVTRVFAESPPESPPADGLGARLLQAMCERLGWDLGELWRVEGNALRREATWCAGTLDGRGLEASAEAFPKGVGLPGRVWADGSAIWAEDLGQAFGVRRVAAARRAGLRAVCAFPIRSEQGLTGVVLLWSRERREPDPTLLTMLTDIGSRIGQHLAHRRAAQELARQRDVLYESEKLAALGQLVAGVAHEMNNPLGIMSSRIELILEDAARQVLPPELVEDLRVLHRNTLRVAGVAQALRSFARQSTGERRPVDLNRVVEETLLLVGKSMSTQNVRIVTALDPALPPLLGDGNALQQVVLNLLTNAHEAMPDGGEIRVETGCRPGEPPRVQLLVSDTGTGISPVDLPHVFEPFYTTKATGTGLGLAVSYGIVHAHEGSIEVDSTPGQGTTFRLAFPALPRAG
jgi:PAS domain S-box-containing protein